MKGEQEVIDLLNETLTGELTAINQYWLHSRICKNWGYEKLAKYMYSEALDEMKHADKLIERILLLDGLPNVQRIGKITVGQTVLEMLQNDHQLEMMALSVLKKAVKVARDLSDNGSEDLFIEILKSEEEHVDWLEAQFDLVKQVGERNYLAQQIHS